MLTRYTIILFIVNERDPQLAASLQGPLFDNAVEILRYLGVGTYEYLGLCCGRGDVP